MNLDDTLRDLANALEAGDGTRRRDAGLRAARQVVADRCLAVLGSEPAGQSITAVIRMAADTPERTARRACAVLVVHALAVPGLVPATCVADVCALLEGALRDVLLRCEYPFIGTTEARLAVLERLHVKLGELMQPFEPTFPSGIQGLYAG